MARIRSVHPEQWTDEDFVGCTPLARLLALALRNDADDRGVFEWKPVVIKMRLLPADTCDITELLGELTTSRQVVRFEAGGKAYGAIRNFARFQRPKHPVYRYPNPPGYQDAAPRTSEIQPKPSGSPGVALTHGEESREEERRGEDKSEVARALEAVAAKVRAAAASDPKPRAAPDPAIGLVVAFDTAILAADPALARPWPNSMDLIVARRMLERGVTAALVHDITAGRMAQRIAQGKGAPKALSYVEDACIEALSKPPAKPNGAAIAKPPAGLTGTEDKRAAHLLAFLRLGGSRWPGDGPAPASVADAKAEYDAIEAKQTDAMLEIPEFLRAKPAPQTAE